MTSSRTGAPFDVRPCPASASTGDPLPSALCPVCHDPFDHDSGACPQCGPAVAVRLGAALGASYEVARLIGRGGFAEVYEVRDRDLRRRLAVKVLRPDIGFSAGTVGRFKHEARSIAKLSHPNIVPIHFVGEKDGLVFYAMPYVEGQSLGDILRVDGALSARRAIAIAIPILEALDHAHRHGLVHRDIKPDNILVESASGRALLVDFGIAKSAETDGAHHTSGGYVVGTPLYMSPEQALGEPRLDARADVYAMGAVLHQMLTGLPPFDGATSQEIVSRHLTEAAPSAAMRDAAVPAWLAAIVIRCLVKRPDDRFQTAADVTAAIRRETGEADPNSESRVAASLGRDAPTLEIPAQTRRRFPAGWVAAAAVLIAALAWWMSRPVPALLLQNRLLAPVVVTIGGRGHLLAPGDSVRQPFSRGDMINAEWRLVPSAALAGRELPAGRFIDQATDGTIRWAIDRAVIGDFVVPVISNGSSGPIRGEVRDASGVPLPCDCTVGAAATLPLGYRRAAVVRTLQFVDAAGRRTHLSIDPGLAAGDAAAISIRITDAEFAPPAVSTGVPTISGPAVRQRGRTATADPAPRAGAAAPDTTRRPRPAQPDPLRGTVTNH